jgi:chemotaxis protein methyltransferase CheR
MTPANTMQASVLPLQSRAKMNPTALSARNYTFLQNFIYAESGIVIEEDKQYLLESRLLPVLKSHEIDSLDSLSEMLARRSSLALIKSVVDSMTTNETLFFRDSTVFDSLKAQVFPEMLKKINGTRKLRIWSAASSSGQEAYSLAMMLLEMGRTKAEIEIVGTDLSGQVLERARQGKYVQFEVGRGLPTPYLMKYFTRSGLDWQLKDDIRSMVRFEQLDLRRELKSMGKFDLVLCRNVLIYFDTPTKKQIVSAIRDVLYPGAMLVLGCAETVTNIHADFKRVLVGQSNFYTL